MTYRIYEEPNHKYLAVVREDGDKLYWLENNETWQPCAYSAGFREILIAKNMNAMEVIEVLAAKKTPDCIFFCFSI